MDFSASNTKLWASVLQLGLLCAILLTANVLRRKVPFLRKSLLPTAVIGGFLALGLRLTGWVPINTQMMETLTYHMTAIGFIALALRIPRRSELTEAARVRHDGLRSGMLIVGSYLVQGILGLAVTMLLGFTLFPGLFKAAGLLLPLGFGQGPGQAYNIGTTYQNLGFSGGGTFGLGIATMGFLCACVGGVIYLNFRIRAKGFVLPGRGEAPGRQHEPVEDPGEAPLTEAVDRFSLQIAMVLLIYLATYFVSLGLTGLIGAASFLGDMSKTLVPLVWGFNFLIGTILALAFKGSLSAMKKLKIMTRQYPNNYLLNRISGSAFDMMILASISAISLSDLQGLWIPFVALCVIGGVATLAYIRFMVKRLFPGYVEEAFFSMYGMMTGTVSTGILLLREVDPDFRTPASNNLVIGSSTAIALGFPLLLLIGLAPKSSLLLWVSMGLMMLYALVLHAVVFLPRIRARIKKGKSSQ
jgi:ESS family glutamate:Na+ symporter